MAIKRLAAPGALDGDGRMSREAEALTRLEHRNVVAIHGVESCDGHALLVMQLVEGVPIDRWADSVASGARGAERVSSLLEVFAEVCDGVAHAHQRGVIHRDIKPGNVLVDTRGSARVLDFGIARLIDESAGTQPTREATTTGFAGTPTYSAPERLAGLPADTRGDVYSLGVLLFRMLAGADPFSHADGLNRLVAAIGSGEVRRPSQVRESVPRDLDWIVLKAMAVDPDRRYQSAGDLAADVRRFLRGEAIVAHPPTHAYRVRTFVGAHRVALAVASLVGAALLAAIVVSWRSMTRTSAALEETAGALRAASLDRDVQQQLASMFREVLRGGDGGNTFGRPDMTVREALDRASERLLENKEAPIHSLPHGPQAEASLRLAIAESYVNIGLVASAETHVLKALELRIAAYGPDARETLEPRHQLARIYRLSGRLEEAASVQRDVVALRRALGHDERFYLAQALTTLGITLRQLGQLQAAEQALREALAIYLDGKELRDDNCAMVLTALALVLAKAGRGEEAEAAGREAVAIGRRYHPDHPHHDLAAALGSLGSVLCSMDSARSGSRIEGEALLRESLEMHRAVSGEGHVHSARAALRLADEIAAQGRAEQAIPLYRSALAGFESRLPPGSPDVVAAANGLRAALEAMGVPVPTDDSASTPSAAHGGAVPRE